MTAHNPAARYCIIGTGIPIDDTADCVACQELYDAAALDPDFAEEYKDYPRPKARGALS
ncbi:hypothetical protein [Mycolicibacterium setense]